MGSDADAPAQYFEALPEARRSFVERLWRTVDEHLPTGFASVMAHGMPAWVVPHRLYPAGYHADPKQPLPFISLASQKHHAALYHMGLYAQPPLLEWFRLEWAGQCSHRLDMGKGCVRMRNAEEVPWKLLGALAARMTPQQWIEAYEGARKAR